MAAPVAVPLVAPARLAVFRRLARAPTLHPAMLAAAVAGWTCLTGPVLAQSAQGAAAVSIIAGGGFPGQPPSFAAELSSEPDTAVAISQAVTQSTVQATPVSALPPDPASAGIRADKAVAVALLAWADAWAARDINAYLSSYGQNFAPPDQQSRKAWEVVRRARIAGKSGISVTLSDLSISVHANRATARFRQDYSADALSISSRKTLDLVRGAGERWLIVRETTGR